MAGKIRLFEKTDAGLLIEVDPAEADKRREGCRVSHVDLSIEVLWTAEEEAARDAEEAAKIEEDRRLATVIAGKAEARVVAVAKLEQLGVSEAELRAILG